MPELSTAICDFIELQIRSIFADCRGLVYDNRPPGWTLNRYFASVGFIGKYGRNNRAYGIPPLTDVEAVS
jgi:hypothetical protein